MNCYADMLAAGESTTLPRAVQSAIDARLEDRIASLLYKQTVEMDIAMSILLQSVNVDEEVLRQERAKSIAAVKRTNGQLRLEQITADIPMRECSWIELTMASSVRRRSYWPPPGCSTTWAIYSGTTPRLPLPTASKSTASGWRSCGKSASPSATSRTTTSWSSNRDFQ
ncbi:MAG: hypothetical protein Q3X77_06570 [Oscillospiraceae bacterium]|nr:hypothetical protein [Oscillospiraceae bacterium]